MPFVRHVSRAFIVQNMEWPTIQNAKPVSIAKEGRNTRGQMMSMDHIVQLGHSVQLAQSLQHHALLDITAINQDCLNWVIATVHQVITAMGVT